MKQTFQILYKNKLVFFILLSFFFLGLILIILTDKYGLHLELNKHYTPFFDIFFKTLTHLGDGISFGFLIVIILFFKRDWATSYIIAGVATLLISYILKHLIFDDYRPSALLGEQLRYVEGVVMKTKHSFPSGHTTAIFTMGILSILYFKKYWIQLLILSITILVGYSRIYLSQHFLEDVIAGAFLGSLIAMISFSLGNHYDFFRKKPTN
jgi:membrane-associated phospholipid phosphatase